ncbi:hypothetical protein NJB1907f44_48990 [Mycobacterium marinum]|uniref:DUF2742 domain-containing protein n=1 Tax=Mycobacterium marinum TaxID=1781 RepID=UPI000E3C7AAB|nr:DUF2742 domain-containing protein [Mycobacterium marinum]RFZ30721.1 hypothetical protein KST_05037 [Mycobacterium marinum]GJN99125.1 hypothetical protein NJB1907E8_50340 [Mycobacterium marinum]GJO06052.1 hypothetical protein NJB1907E90_16780 [Mycobacterium marinum]GJO10644.1 hypothetical protein NJB1808e29_46580 [Mycobacterium marinum]GJO14491.1 hypothetical protein NJB1907f34b_51000 [Mycobacterium marinum]
MSPPGRESRPAGNRTADPLAADGSIVSAQQTYWLEVHDLVAPILDSVGSWPLLGSPEWCSLPTSSPRKWAAILDGGQHHALRLELNQQARAEASQTISASADWSQIGREVRQRRGFYAEKPWVKRVVTP